jgi:hypothetical protein
MTYPQPPGGQFPQGPYGGLYGAPPPKKNTGAIVAVVAVVVLALGALGITGFVAPGFFLSEETTSQPAPRTTAATSSEPSPRDFLRTVVDGLDSRDTAALKDITCAAAASAVDSALDDLDSVEGATLVDSEERSGDEAVGTVEVTTATRTSEFDVTVTKDGDDWCWQDIERSDVDEPIESPVGEPSTEPGNTEPGTPTAGGQPVAPEAVRAMQDFLDSVNAGNAAKAKSKLCGDAISTPADVDELVGYDPDLSIDPTMDGVASSDKSVQLYLRGTAKGQELEGYSTNLWVTNYDGPWCVHAFRAVVI